MAAPAYRSDVTMIPEAVHARMRGSSWHPDPRCPTVDALRLVHVSHWDFAGQVASGQLIVAAGVAEEVVQIFAALFAIRFPIARMDLIDVFAGDDDASMAANNTSAFNFRNVAGTEVLSQHALGLAIDINPVVNPMVIGAAIYPPAGVAYLDRTRECPGLITRPGPVVDVFAAHRWQWGGDWSPMKDYHHFVKTR